MESSDGSLIRRSLPSAGSLGPVPPPPRYYETLRPPAARPAALRCLRLAVPPLRLVCSQRPRRTVVGGGELIFRVPSRICRWKRQGLPGSRATLNVPGPCSWTPVGPDTPGRYSAPTWPPHVSTTRAPAIEVFGARSQSLRTGCLRFAVRIAPPHARLVWG
jgi:hypothetical protein